MRLKQKGWIYKTTRLRDWMAVVVCSWDVWAWRLKVKRKHRFESCWNTGGNCSHRYRWYPQRAEKGV